MSLHNSLEMGPACRLCPFHRSAVFASHKLEENRTLRSQPGPRTRLALVLCLRFLSRSFSIRSPRWWVTERMVATAFAPRPAVATGPCPSTRLSKPAAALPGHGPREHRHRHNRPCEVARPPGAGRRASGCGVAVPPTRGHGCCARVAWRAVSTQMLHAEVSDTAARRAVLPGALDADGAGAGGAELPLAILSVHPDVERATSVK